jgi:hypothetical protein
MASPDYGQVSSAGLTAFHSRCCVGPANREVTAEPSPGRAVRQSNSVSRGLQRDAK